MIASSRWRPAVAPITGATTPTWLTSHASAMLAGETVAGHAANCVQDVEVRDAVGLGRGRPCGVGLAAALARAGEQSARQRAVGEHDHAHVAAHRQQFLFVFAVDEVVPGLHRDELREARRQRRRSGALRTARPPCRWPPGSGPGGLGETRPGRTGQRALLDRTRAPVPAHSPQLWRSGSCICSAAWGSGMRSCRSRSISEFSSMPSSSAMLVSHSQSRKMTMAPSVP